VLKEAMAVPEAYFSAVFLGIYLPEAAGIFPVEGVVYRQVKI
jgi:hypothetical protein